MIESSEYSWKRGQAPIAASGPKGASHHWGLTPFPATHMKNENALGTDFVAIRGRSSYAWIPCLDDDAAVDQIDERTTGRSIESPLSTVDFLFGLAWHCPPTSDGMWSAASRTAPIRCDVNQNAITRHASPQRHDKRQHLVTFLAGRFHTPGFNPRAGCDGSFRDGASASG